MEVYWMGNQESPSYCQANQRYHAQTCLILKVHKVQIKKGLQLYLQWHTTNVNSKQMSKDFQGVGCPVDKQG